MCNVLKGPCGRAHNFGSQITYSIEMCLLAELVDLVHSIAILKSNYWFANAILHPKWADGSGSDFIFYWIHPLPSVCIILIMNALCIVIDISSTQIWWCGVCRTHTHSFVSERIERAIKIVWIHCYLVFVIISIAQRNIISALFSGMVFHIFFPAFSIFI